MVEILDPLDQEQVIVRPPLLEVEPETLQPGLSDERDDYRELTHLKYKNTTTTSHSAGALSGVDDPDAFETVTINGTKYLRALYLP